MIKIVYAIIAVISLLLIAGYYYLIKKREKWFVLLYCSVFVVNLGYFLLAVSKSLSFALWANRLSYLGSVLLPLCMLMIILNVCKIKCRVWLVYILSAVSAVVFAIAASGGVTEWYYKSVSLTFVNNTARLLKEYGPLHNLYYLYLGTYFVAMLGVIIYATKKKHMFNDKHAMFLVCVVFGNIGIWFVEQVVKIDFEFLSISYMVTELFLLFLYGILQEYGKALSHDPNERMTLDVFIKNCSQLNCLTARELEVIKPILEDKKRKEIAEELNVTESTIKKHPAHIFEKLEVYSRKELYEKIGYRT